MTNQNDNETPREVIAEMRNLGKLDRTCRDMIPRRLMGLGLQTYADRIEAAAEREREMSKGLSKKLDKNHAIPGNAAAMRAALEEARKVIEAMGGYWAAKTLPIIDAALAAPPRNCNRFKNTAHALGAYPDGPPIGEEWGDGDWMAFCDWLFAPAEAAK